MQLEAGLTYSSESREILASNLFVRMHRAIEIEHIRRGTANFLRFCPTLAERTAFMRGFDHALLFWTRFWDALGEILEQNQGR